MEEIWKDVVGYEGIYQVSNIGRVRSLDRSYDIVTKDGFPRHVKLKGKLLSPQRCSNGYMFVNLSKDAIHKQKLVHRLVAIAFLPNPHELPEVNHKDEDINNNRADNLEWCTSKYNANYGTRNERCYPHWQLKPVNQLSKDGTLIKRWRCMSDAGRELHIDITQISGVCKHKKEYVTAGGYKWEYA